MPRHAKATASIRLDEAGGLDEVCVYWLGRCWLHLERMDTHQWALNVGDKLIYATVTRGKEKVVVAE